MLGFKGTLKSFGNTILTHLLPMVPKMLTFASDVESSFILLVHEFLVYGSILVTQGNSEILLFHSICLLDNNAFAASKKKHLTQTYHLLKARRALLVLC